MGMQRSETIPEDIRSTVRTQGLLISCSQPSPHHVFVKVMNLFRLPLNIFVVVVLSKERHPSLVLMICAAALAFASVLQVRRSPSSPTVRTPPPNHTLHPAFPQLAFSKIAPSVPAAVPLEDDFAGDDSETL